MSGGQVSVSLGSVVASHPRPRRSWHRRLHQADLPDRDDSAVPHIGTEPAHQSGMRRAVGINLRQIPRLGDARPCLAGLISAAWDTGLTTPDYFNANAGRYSLSARLPFGRLMR